VSIGFSYLLYAAFALGGAGLYLCMPGRDKAALRSGGLVGLCAVIGLLVLVGLKFMAPHATNVYFYTFAGLALIAAGKVVTHPKPVYSAVYFGMVVLCVAVLLVVQQAEFLAVALVIVYAGAILVTYAFVIMLAQQSGESPVDTRSRDPMVAVLIAFVTMGALTGRIGDLDQVAPAPWSGPPAIAEAGDQQLYDGQLERADNTVLVGRRLFGQYIVVVELAGLLLLVAMVGAIAIAKKSVPVHQMGPEPRPPGQIGREAPPF